MDVLDHEGASDARLTIAAGRGDDEAFAVLYARYAPRIGAYLQRLVDDEHLAQDLTHEVFVSALDRLRSARPPIAFGPWLYRIARNASIDVHRRSQLVRQVPLPAPEDESGALRGHHEPPAQAELRQWVDDLRDLLGGLSENHRSVLVLRELEGLSNSEIAERMGVSRPAVEGLLFRARAKMRSEYDDLTSGRRCARVQAAVDRAGAGERLGSRDLQLASRHLGGCAQCRRHAWQAGVTDLLERATVRRRALLPAPLLGFLSRLSGHDPSPLVAPWGRTAAAVTAVAIAGGAAPHLREAAAPPRPVALVARSASSAPTVLATRPAPPVRSAAVTATALPHATASVPLRTAAPAPAPAAPAPATQDAAAPRPVAAPEQHAAQVLAPAPAAPQVAAAPARPAPQATAARTRETVGSVVEPVAQVAPAAVAAPIHNAAAAAGNALEAAAATVEHALPTVTLPAPLEAAPLVSEAVGELLTPGLPAIEAPATPAIPEVAPAIPAVG